MTRLAFAFAFVAVTAAAFLVVSLLAPSLARAQIVNVQPLLDKQARQGFSGSVEASADWRSGNTNLTLLGGDGIAQWRRQRHLVFVTLHGELGTKSGVELVSKDLEHLRYRVRLIRALAAEAFVQHDADAFRRRAVRALGGVGLRLRVVDGKWVTFAVAAAYMFEYERLAGGMFSDAHREIIANRLSTYAVITVGQGRIVLAHTVYAQPRLDDFSDVRWLHDSTLALTVTRYLSVRFSATLTLDTRPPEGVQPLDTALKSALALTF
ncbi:MAG: uncharacterized protein JWN44_6195 [Myxococcales bacterium]|nr:uncharacterized protein [Myxococcales bacterium]